MGSSARSLLIDWYLIKCNNSSISLVLLFVYPNINKKRTAREELFFFYCYQFLEEEVVNFMNEMLTEEGNSTMHDDEDDEVFERAVHNNTCFNFMF